MNTGTVLRTAVLLASLLAVPASSHAAETSTNLNFWVIDDGQWMQQLVSGYNNTTPSTQVTLTYVPADQYVSRFTAAEASGNGPDLVDFDLINTPNFAAAGLLADITSQVRRLPYFHTLSPAHMRLATYRGRIFALPIAGNSSVLVYNKALFRRAGLDPNSAPSTWSAIQQDARKITALGKGIYGYAFSGNCAACIAYEFLPLIWASGGDVLDPGGTQPILTDSPPVRAALAFYHRLWIDGLVSPSSRNDGGSLQENGFWSGTVGMIITGDTDVGSLEQQQSPQFDFGVGYIPGQSGGRSAFAGGENVAAVRDSPHAAAAWDFLSWCADAYVQRDLVMQNGADPVRSDILNLNDFGWDNRRMLAAQAMFQGRAPYAIPYFALFNDQRGPLLALFDQAVFAGQIDTAIATAQQRFSQILDH